MEKHRMSTSAIPLTMRRQSKGTASTSRCLAENAYLIHSPHLKVNHATHRATAELTRGPDLHANCRISDQRARGKPALKSQHSAAVDQSSGANGQ